MITEIESNQYRVRLAKHRSVLEKKIITSDEFVLKVVEDLLTVKLNELAVCIAELNSDELTNINTYFDTKVRKDNFDPSPVGFLSPTDDFESVKQILATRYGEIDKLLMEEKCAD